jgi:hypothetical protein
MFQMESSTRSLQLHDPQLVKLIIIYKLSFLHFLDAVTLVQKSLELQLELENLLELWRIASQRIFNI